MRKPSFIVFLQRPSDRASGTKTINRGLSNKALKMQIG
jgi:hypothetical protein